MELNQNPTSISNSLILYKKAPFGVGDSQTTPAYFGINQQKTESSVLIPRERSPEKKLERILVAKMMKSLLTGVDIPKALERRNEFLELVGAPKIDLNQIKDQTAKRQLEKLLAASLGAYFSMTSAVNSKYDFYGAGSEHIQVAPVMMMNKIAMKYFYKSMPQNKIITSFALDGDVEGFGRVNNINHNYADDKKQQLSQSMLDFVKNQGQDIIKSVLESMNSSELKAADFQIKFFNNNKSDEYKLCVAYNGPISDELVPVVAAADRRIAERIAQGFIQHLASKSGKITTFTSPTPLDSSGIPNTDNLKVRFVEESFNYPHTLADINRDKLLAIKNHLEGKSEAYQKEFLKITQDYWLYMRNTGLKGFEDFEVLFFSYLKEAYNLETLEVNSEYKAIIDKEKADKANKILEKKDKEEKFEDSKYRNSPWYSYLISAIKPLLQDLPDQQKQEFLQKIDSILDNFRLTPFPIEFKNTFPTMNWNLLKTMHETTKNLDPKLWEDSEIIVAKINFKGWNDARHTLGDHMIRQVQKQIIKTTEETIQSNQALPPHFTETIKKYPDGAELLPEIVKNCVLMSSVGPCPVLVFPNHYYSMLEKNYPGEENKQKRQELQELCRYIIGKIKVAIIEIKEVSVNIAEGDKETSMLPIGMGIAPIEGGLSESAGKAENQGKDRLNDFLFEKMLAVSNFDNLLKNLEDFILDGKYKLKGETWPDLLCSSMCEAKRGLAFITNLAKRIDQLVTDNPTVTNFTNFDKIVKMIDKIGKKLIENQKGNANQQPTGVRLQLQGQISVTQKELELIIDDLEKQSFHQKLQNLRSKNFQQTAV